MEGKNYETTLPAGYKEACSVDAKDTKFGFLMNAAAALIFVGLVALYVLATGFRAEDFFRAGETHTILRFPVAGIVLLLYLVLHELTHGAAYKLLTHRKLTFGISLTAAWCGVPEIYVYRKTALISLLAPFTVFTLLFGAAVLLLRDPGDRITAFGVLALHVGGCAGDLYDTFLYLFRFRDPGTLMQDTGPKQTFWVKE